MPKKGRLRDEDLIALVRSGMSYQAIAERYGYSRPDSVRGMYSTALKRSAAAWRAGVADGPRYDDCPALYGPTLILSDVHFPTTRYDLLNLALLFGEKHMAAGQRQVLLLGDLVNFDAVSAHPAIAPAMTLTQELSIAQRFLERLLQTFDRVLYVQGNHEDRLHRVLAGALYGHPFMALLTGGMNDKRLTVSLATRARVYAGGQVWHCTHQRSYSKLAGRVARELALKEQANVVSAHQHHVSISRDPFNRYVAIDSGGLFDQRRMLYASRTDSTAPVMANGFVFIDDAGCGHLLTPYPSMTNWGLWGLRDEAQRFIEQPKRRRGPARAVFAAADA